MLVAFSVSPSGGVPAPGAAADSVSRAVADAVRIVRESGLPNSTDAMFTTIEGSWDECFDVVRRATEAVARYGSRVSLVLKADLRPGHDTGELAGKVERVEARLQDADPATE
ncbi:thiamine-binding protein [Nakamurella leprariae]|uniref:Thiamine-binding protein n=1 Tax=Nakamurella leprariae TaxID=2803911 RepID=A0A938YFL0_9ACTN|nr:thiamine-binding protein [Nakamurella leprariae]MBM9468673.1 thiamine-binding protein [Nakamurella leprariae]